MCWSCQNTYDGTEKQVFRWWSSYAVVKKLSLTFINLFSLFYKNVKLIDTIYGIIMEMDEPNAVRWEHFVTCIAYRWETKRIQGVW